jgi:uncharacterized protein (DUF433 family)
MRLPERIAVDPEIMMGKPCVKGTRIPEANIRSILAKWLPKLTETDLHGRLVIVDVEKIRIRRAIEAG